jgi:hypothetical protein
MSSKLIPRILANIRAMMEKANESLKYATTCGRMGKWDMEKTYY